MTLGPDTAANGSTAKTASLEEEARALAHDQQHFKRAVGPVSRPFDQALLGEAFERAQEHLGASATDGAAPSKAASGFSITII